ncbi:MAG TPA: ferritin-like domain-containing protein [Kofleriaceae bacterium]|nr:ferritin-like domain-containing protein [Kofleriaceae bacterium]
MTAPNIRVEHRESLAFALSEAAELEHGLLCCYLYTAFSIGPRCERRHAAEQAAAIARWRAEITDIARDEMIHLALVSNLLNAIGAAPHFMRPNFPVASGYHPAGIVVSLAPFCLSTIQHFVYLERPEDVIEREGEGFARRPYTRIGHAGRLVPSGQDYATQGDLYRWIRDGFAHLIELHGAAQVLCGDPRLQVTSSQLGLPGVTAVTDLASAERALDTIVTQGEGAPQCPGHSHYSRFLAIRNELEAVLAADPTFAPAAGIAYNPVMRQPANPEGLVWVDAEPAASVLDVANAIYAFTLRALGVLYSPVALAGESRALALEAVNTGMRGLTPIGELLTELPARRSDPAVRAGVSFAMSRSLHPLPEPRAALRTLYEAIAAVAGGIRSHVVPLDASLLATAERFDDLAHRLERAADRAAAITAAVPAESAAARAPDSPMPSTRVAAPGGTGAGTGAGTGEGTGGIEEARGEQLVLRFEARRCIHARHCVLGAPRVFLANVKGPWLHPDEMPVEGLVHIARSCPSGAITYQRLDGGADEPVPEVNELRLRENGPYAVRADVELAGHGRLLRATLCRCGASSNKPFCDGSHNAARFAATGEPATRESTPLARRGGRLEIRPQPDGPLVLTGSLEICAGTGRTVDRVSSARLCRCGGSSTKPFCDGTHAKIGFRAP